MLSGRASFEGRIAFQPDAEQRGNGSCADGLRVVAQKPLPGSIYPLQPQDIRAFLLSLGPSAVYGLRIIRLRQECLLNPSNMIFAEYVVPGEIHLYAVPAIPWRFAFVPSRTDLEAFARHGASVSIDVDTAQGQTTVFWTPNTLKSYFLVEVLAHEIGHHVLQHNRGKRQAQICRRFDHEACADLYSRRAGRVFNTQNKCPIYAK